MTARVLFLVILAAALGAPTIAGAEKVRTNQPTNLLSRPGERANVIGKVKEGQAMTVLAKESRWLKVRVSGRTGWVPRSKVDATEEIARNTRRRAFVDGRGTKRGFNGEEGPDDRVGADALGETEGRSTGDDDSGDDRGNDDDDDDDAKPSKPRKPSKPPPKRARGGGDDPLPSKSKGGGGGDDDDDLVVDDEGGGDDEVDDRPRARVTRKAVAYAEPDDDSDEAFAASAGTILFPTGTKKGKFTEVENEEGDIGFVVSSALSIEGGAGGGPRQRTIDATARLGFSFFQQGVRTPNAPVGLPDNYNIATSAATLSLGGMVLYPYKAKLVLGGQMTYDYAKAIPGIKEEDNTTTSIGLHHLRARGMVGYDLGSKSGMAVFGRLGVHYQSYQVANADNLARNTAKLPSEIITSPAIGAGLMMPRLTPKIGLRFSLDAILFGASVKQTKNLEDGASPKAKAALFNAGFVYRWKKAFDIQASYDLNYYKMKFGAAVETSQRGHMGGNVSRTDFFHAVTVGIARGF